MSKRKSVDTVEKRKRDPTFTASEKMTLIELVKKHFHIVESKKTDALSIKNKNDEWRKLETEFNAISSIYLRDWSVLRNCWENLKKRAKQEHNQYLLGTVVGGSKRLNEDPVIEQVLALIKSRITGYSDPLADASQFLELNHTDTAPIDTVDWPQHDSVLSPSPSHSEDIEQEGQQSSTPMSAHIPTSRRRPALRRIRGVQSLAIQRLSALELANTHAQEEHEIKMNILRLQEEQESIKVKQELLKLKILEDNYKN